MLKIRIPKDCNYQERKYIIDILFGEFLGVPYEINVDDDLQEYRIILPNGNILSVEDSFWKNFSKPLEYLDIRNIPKEVKKVDIFGENVPIIYGTDRISFSESDKNKHFILGLDIFASSFFMLSRWEEYVSDKKDIHNRFPGKDSLAYKEGFIDKPIVNQYLEILWKTLTNLGINYERKKRNFIFNLTSDIDNFFDPIFYSYGRFFRTLVSNIITQRDMNRFWGTLKSFFTRKDELHNGIYRIINLANKASMKVKFYVIPLRTHHLDSLLDIDNERVGKILQDIYGMGHEIGVHPGYSTYNNKNLFMESLHKLKVVLERNGIKGDIRGGRQHYLRWDVSITPLLWDEASLSYDSTLGFPDIAGFRCGICYEFPIFSILDRKVLSVYEVPLINMDGTIIAYEKMGFTQKALERFIYFKNVCRKYSGTYTLLWHNLYATSSGEISFLEDIIRA